MFVKDRMKQLGPCSINRSIESTNEMITFINNIQQDNAVVVIVNLNHEVIYIICFENNIFYLKLNTYLSYAI